MLALADGRAESAEEVGAANVLAVRSERRVVAHNTDAEALAHDLEALSPRRAAPGRGRHRRPGCAPPSSASGGAALAALVACRRLGFKVVCMTSRSWIDTEAVYDAPSRARAARSLGALTAPWPRPDETAPSGKLSQALRLQWGELVAHADCIVQATSAGMSAPIRART